jgi:hypothetical protein
MADRLLKTGLAKLWPLPSYSSFNTHQEFGKWLKDWLGLHSFEPSEWVEDGKT